MTDANRKLALVALLAVLSLRGGCDLPSLAPSSTVTQVTYVYEKDDGAVPSPVRVAINRLNRETEIIATEFEDDALDGNEEVPAQYRIALPAAKGAGLPALVVQAGDKVLRIVKSPSTEAHVMEAAK